MVECDLAKVEVAGSNPVSRSNFFIMSPRPRVFLCLRRTSGAPSPSGKAEVCKTSISGSNPDGASILNRSIPVTWVTVPARRLGNSWEQLALDCLDREPMRGIDDVQRALQQLRFAERFA